MAARVAAEAGAKVIMVERRTHVGQPVQCAGWVSAAIRKHQALPEKCVVQSVNVLRTILLDGSIHEVTTLGYILDRAVFDQYLADNAVAAGVRLLLNTRVVAPSANGLRKGVSVQQGTDRFEISAGVIVGADGPLSTVARLANQASPRWSMALQYDVRLCQPLTAGIVQFRKALPGGYGWLFPAGELARVGVASMVGTPTCRTELDSFLQELGVAGLVSDKPLKTGGGLIPVGPPRARVGEKVILVGDAANHNHAISGAGINNAIVAGKMAGQSAARAALAGDLSLLDEYAEEVGSGLNPALEKALEKHVRLAAAWGGDTDSVSNHLRKSWIGFDAYYRS
jgi:geranylgeranyl reductase family protein